MSRLRCLTPKIGAGFGNKMEPHVQPIVVLLAMKAKRPVKLIFSFQSIVPPADGSVRLSASGAHGHAGDQGSPASDACPVLRRQR
jgi:CO/xanthine dehydrogenase Mo-binding subunit